MLSSFSIISVIGVMLGVLVLVVVMAVYAGLERNVKERLLGYTPHVLMSNFGGPISDWEDAAKRAKAFSDVVAATPFASGYVFIEAQSRPQPVSFRGIDTSDKEQVEGIRKMLALADHPQSSADLGIDDRVVVSSQLADQLGIAVGDPVLLQSTSNFDGVRKAYQTASNPPLREAYAEAWGRISETLTTGWKPDGDGFTLSFPVWREIYQSLLTLFEEDIRQPELDLVETILTSMDSSVQDPDAEVFRFSKEIQAAAVEAVEALNTSDVEKIDGATLKSFKSAVLPKEAEVSGIYQASQMTVTPDLFVPLHLAQSLAGLDQGVEGIALRLEDPYEADAFADKAREALGPDWSLLTWGQQYGAFFALIEQQRGMMYFTLSFIMLISAFSMMAVMFTVTIQKRREIGVMKALGAAPGQIVRVFLYQGMILGTVGAILGVVLGRLVIRYIAEIQGFLRTFGIDPFTSQFTGFTRLPTHSEPGEQAVFALMAFVLCSLAALVPAWFAARSDAAKSLRNL